MKTLTPNFSSMVGLLVVTSNSLPKAPATSYKVNDARPVGSSLQRLVHLDPVTFTFDQEAVASKRPRFTRIATDESEVRRKISRKIRNQSVKQEDTKATAATSASVDSMQLLPLLVAAIRELEMKLRRVEEELKEATAPLSNL